MKVFSKLTADTKKHKCTSLILKLNLEKSKKKKKKNNLRVHVPRVSFIPPIPI